MTAPRDMPDADGYPEWVRGVTKRLDGVTFSPAICSACGGTGVEVVRCCNGYECACRGQAVDFRRCSRGCVPPYWWPKP